MGHHTSPYWIFRSGEAFVDMFLRMADFLFQPLHESALIEGSAIDVAADIFGWDYLDYSIFDLVVGPGLMVVFCLAIVRWLKP